MSLQLQQHQHQTLTTFIKYSIIHISIKLRNNRNLIGQVLPSENNVWERLYGVSTIMING